MSISQKEVNWQKTDAKKNGFDRGTAKLHELTFFAYQSSTNTYYEL